MHTAMRWKMEPYHTTAAARSSCQAGQKPGETVTAAKFARMLDKACATDRFTRHLDIFNAAPDKLIRRAHACQLIFTVLETP